MSLFGSHPSSRYQAARQTWRTTVRVNAYGPSPKDDKQIIGVSTGSVWQSPPGFHPDTQTHPPVPRSIHYLYRTQTTRTSVANKIVCSKYLIIQVKFTEIAALCYRGFVTYVSVIRSIKKVCPHPPFVYDPERVVLRLLGTNLCNRWFPLGTTCDKPILLLRSQATAGAFDQKRESAIDCRLNPTLG